MWLVGNNQQYGSPVNRIRITGAWASRSLTRQPALSLVQRVRAYAGYAGFLAVLLGTDLAFWAARARQWLAGLLGVASGGFEDELERTMRGFAKSNFGVDIAQTAFEG